MKAPRSAGKAERGRAELPVRSGALLQRVRDLRRAPRVPLGLRASSGMGLGDRRRRRGRIERRSCGFRA